MEYLEFSGPSAGARRPGARLAGLDPALGRVPRGAGGGRGAGAAAADP